MSAKSFLLVALLPLLAGIPSAWAQTYPTDEDIFLPQLSFDEITAEPVQQSAKLYEVLRDVYARNPTLRAARAELRAVQETLPQALAGYRPTVTGDTDVTFTDTTSEGNSAFTQDGTNVSKTVGVNLTQPLYRGGQTLAATRGAKNIILAQRFNLKSVEQQVFLGTATAYMDVLRDKALLVLSENNRQLINRQLEQTQDRFTVGELTQTDVAQAQARLAEAEAGITTARANLRASMATYEQMTGVVPEEKLLYPEMRFIFPSSLDEATSVAAQDNPEILTAEFANAAAEDNVDEIFGQLLPSISLLGGATKAYDPAPGFLDEQDVVSVGVSASIPLYEAGSVRSKVRQAKQTANQRYLEILEARRAARQQTIASWERLSAAEAEITSRQSQVKAAARAREGVKDAADFGERTVIDSLDADQEYLEAEVRLVTARRDEVVARFFLAAALGRLTPQTLGFPEDEIDPDLHLNASVNNLFGTGTEIDEDR